jgi:hypothetical protein
MWLLNGTQRNVSERGDETKGPWPFWPCFDLEPPRQLLELPMSRVPWPPPPKQLQFVFGTAHGGQNYWFAGRLHNQSKYLGQQLNPTRHTNPPSSVTNLIDRKDGPLHRAAEAPGSPNTDGAPVLLSWERRRADATWRRAGMRKGAVGGRNPAALLLGLWTRASASLRRSLSRCRFGQFLCQRPWLWGWRMPPPAAVYVFGGCVSAPATAGCVSAVRAAGPGPGVAEWDAYAAPREYSVSQSWPRPTVQCIAGLVFGRQEF